MDKQDSLESLIELFKKHSEEFEKDQAEQGLVPEFNLPDAFVLICREIQELKRHKS